MSFGPRDDQIVGCLLGGALGDAIGAHFEGCLMGTAFKFPNILRITDDTQLTLATCEAIIDKGIAEPESVAAHFTHWFRQRRITGIGASTLKSLRELDAGGHWALVGAIGEHSAGNGAAMRVAPFAFLLDPDDASQRRTIRDVCRITHRNDEAYIGALAVLRAIRLGAKDGELSGHSLTGITQSLPDSNVRDRLLEIQASTPTLAEFASRYGTTGYVADSVPMAILAARGATSILEMIQQIVECGGDTDTIASMAGQMFGAIHGTKAVPSELIDQIDEWRMIREIAVQFARMAFAIPGEGKA